MANPADLVTLADAKQWLTINATVTDAADAILSGWITRASRGVINYLNRDSSLGYRQISTILDGNNQSVILLPQWPVLGVSSLSINGSPQVAQTDPPFGNGYAFDAWTGDDTQGHQRLAVYGNYFPRGVRNIAVTYTAGYQAQQEPHTIPAATPFTVDTLRPYFSDQGVVKANDLTPFVYVTGAPDVGEYTINTQGQYVFNEDDASTDVLITYSYTPDDLKQAVLDIITYWYRNRDRVGIVSRALGGNESTSYMTSPMPDYTKLLLDPYRSVTPL